MKKHLLLLIPIMGLLLAGCSSSPEPVDTGSGPTSASTNTGTITPPSGSGPDAGTNHLTKIAISPSKDFIAAVGQTFKFSVSYTGGQKDNPIPEEEKEVTWTVNRPALATIEPIEGSHNVNVTFIGTGSVTVTVTSQYNTSFTKSTSVKIYRGDEYHYVWNCTEAAKDSAKFSQPENDAVLNEVKWHYKRYEPSTAGNDGDGVQGSQSIKFGSGDLPEGRIDLTLHNTRKVEQIVVSCSSQARDTDVPSPSGHGYVPEDHGSSQITIKVGDTTYYGPEYTERGDDPEPVTSITPETLVGGDITISLSASVGYIFLKNIIIVYSHALESIAVSPTSPHKTMFDKNETFSSDGLVVLAKFDNDDVLVPLTSETIGLSVTAPDMSTVGEKDVTVSYGIDGVTKSTSYKVYVNEHRDIVSVALQGDISAEKGRCYAGDRIDWSDITVLITWDAQDYAGSTTTTLALPTSDGGLFTDVHVPEFARKDAELDMNLAFDISLKYANWPAGKSFADHDFEVIIMEADFNFGKDGEGNYIIPEVATWTGNVAKRSLSAADGKISFAGSFKLDASTDPYPYGTCSNPIIISVPDGKPNFAIESVTAEFVQSGDANPKLEFKIASSVLGQAPYGEELKSVSGWKNHEMSISYSEFATGTNAVKLYYSSSSSSSKFGLKHIHVKLKEETTMVVDTVTIKDGTAPTKTTYKYGFEEFDPTGLQVLANSTNPTAYPSIDVTSEVSWPKFTAAGDSVSLTGTYKGKNVVVNNLKVVAPDSLTIEGTIPEDKRDYQSGDAFDPTGLTVYANFPAESELTREDITNNANLSWDTLEAGDPTHATCHFNALSQNTEDVLHVSGYDDGDTFDKVTGNVAEGALEDGVYLIVSTAQGYVINGNLTSAGGASTGYTKANHLQATLADPYTAESALINSATFQITRITSGAEENRYTIKSTATNKYIGLNDGGAFAISDSDTLSSKISVESGNVIITNEDRAASGITRKYLGFNASYCVSTYTSKGSNPIQLYKIR